MHNPFFLFFMFLLNPSFFWKGGAQMDAITELKNKVAAKIEAMLEQELSCEEILKLAQATTELERNEVFSKLGSSGLFGVSKAAEPAQLADAPPQPE